MQFPDPKDEQEFIWTKEPNEVFVELRTDLSFDEFKEEFGNDIEKYSTAFGDIEIYTVTNGRKHRYFGAETA